MTTFSEFGPRLHEAALALNLEISADQEQLLLAYLGQLQRWNRTYNLTAVRDPEQMLIQHVFDSLAVVSSCNEILDKNTVQPVMVDVGSGAGLPGVVLAIMIPAATVHCIDTVEKKATFIRHAASVLRLPDFHVHHARVEALPPVGADIVISRAFASLLDFATLAGKHVSPTGRLLAMKGRVPTDEIAALQGATTWVVERIEPLQVPELDAQRCLVWLIQQGIV